jgi:transposase
MLEEDEQALRKLAKSCRDAKEQNRYLALHAISIGKSIGLVADVFCVDRTSIYNWIVKWKEERSLEDEPRTGRPNLLTEEQKQEIRSLIEENNPKKYGINASAWDTKELQQYFSEKGTEISRETLRMALRQMGAHYVKAVISYAEADRRQQEAFARSFFKETEENRGKALIFFEDEMSANCSARKGYGWTFGDRLVIKAPQKSKKRLNCFGAVNPFSGEVAEMATKQAKTEAFVRFIRTKLIERHPDRRIIIYLDRLPVHLSGKAVKFLEKHPMVELRFIPPYSPELNPVEQWWGWKRKKFLDNQNFCSQHHLALAMASFARNAEPETVRSVCSLEPLYNLLG